MDREIDSEYLNRIRQMVKDVREKNRPRTLEELKNMGRGSRTLMKRNLERRAIRIRMQVQIEQSKSQSKNGTESLDRG